MPLHRFSLLNVRGIQLGTGMTRNLTAPLASVGAALASWTLHPSRNVLYRLPLALFWSPLMILRWGRWPVDGVSPPCSVVCHGHSSQAVAAGFERRYIPAQLPLVFPVSGYFTYQAVLSRGVYVSKPISNPDESPRRVNRRPRAPLRAIVHLSIPLGFPGADVHCLEVVEVEPSRVHGDSSPRIPELLNRQIGPRPSALSRLVVTPGPSFGARANSSLSSLHSV